MKPGLFVCLFKGRSAHTNTSDVRFIAEASFAYTQVKQSFSDRAENEAKDMMATEDKDGDGLVQWVEFDGKWCKLCSLCVCVWYANVRLL
jgi:hypothetical protein